MCRSNFKLSTAFILIAILAIGCANVKYVGNSFDPTDDVDMYFSKEEIKKEYTIIGHAVGSSGLFGSDDQVMEKLIEKAKSVGADAILVKGIGISDISSGDGAHEETRVTASFIKYE